MQFYGGIKSALLPISLFQMGETLENTNVKGVFIGFAILIFLFIGGDILFFRYAYYFQTEMIIMLYEFIIAVAMLISILYLYMQYKYFPSFTSKPLPEALITSIVGIFIIWLLAFFLFLFLFDRNNVSPSINSVLNSPSPYFYINLFMMVIFSPILEEILMRGYFFELLEKKWNIKYALVVTIIFSMITHYKHGVGIIAVAFYNIVFAILYLAGGLVASIVGHIFLNYFMIYFIHT